MHEKMQGTTNEEGKEGPAPGEPATAQVRLTLGVDTRRRVTLAAMFANKVARAMFYVIFFALAGYAFNVKYGWAPTSTQGVVAWASLFGFARPVLCYWSDTRPIGKSRRKSYGQIGNVLLLASAGLLFVAEWALLVSVIIYGLGESFSDVAYDSLALDLSAAEPTMKNRTRASMRTGAAVGQMIGFIAGGFLVQVAWEAFLGINVAILIATTIILSRVEEKPITREQIASARKEAPAFAKPEKKVYVNLLWVMALVVIIPYFATGLSNAMQDAYLIDRFGTPPALFFTGEWVAALVATVALIAMYAAFKNSTSNFAWLWYITLPLNGIYYLALVWWAPTFEWYVFWNVIANTTSLLNVLIVDRVLMDAVKGAQRGWTFQVFIVFMSAGTFAGGIAGSILGADIMLGINGIFILSGVLWMACPFLLVLFVDRILKRLAAITRER